MSDLTTAVEAPTPSTPRRITALHVTEVTALRDWGKIVRGMFRGAMPYHVGSSSVDGPWRDVDVRVMLDAADYADLADVLDINRLNHVVSLWGQRVTGLPIDFQVQARDEANAEYGGRRRIPIGMGWKR